MERKNHSQSSDTNSRAVATQKQPIQKNLSELFKITPPGLHAKQSINLPTVWYFVSNVQIKHNHVSNTYQRKRKICQETQRKTCQETWFNSPTASTKESHPQTNIMKKVSQCFVWNAIGTELTFCKRHIKPSQPNQPYFRRDSRECSQISMAAWMKQARVTYALLLQWHLLLNNTSVRNLYM
jgi:hypothetical protein